MRFGLALDFGSARHTLAEQLSRFEPLLLLAARYEFESVWVGEAYPSSARDFRAFHSPSSLLVAAALSSMTDLALGSGVTLLPAWKPLKLAYDAASLDSLTAGRFTLGVGLGSKELQARFGKEGISLRALADETLGLLKAAWRGDNFEGEHFAVDAGSFPSPHTPGGPPVLVGGRVRAAAQRAALLGDGYYASTAHHLAAVTAQSDAYYTELHSQADAAVGMVAANRIAFIAPTDSEATETARTHAGRLLGAYAAFGSLGPGQWSELSPQSTYDRAGPSRCIVGSPKSAIAQIRAYARAGVTDLQLRVCPRGTPVATSMRTVSLLGEVVIPAYRQDWVEGGT